MLTSLLRIFTQEQKNVTVSLHRKQLMNQATNGNVLWDVTRSRVSAKKKKTL